MAGGIIFSLCHVRSFLLDDGKLGSAWKQSRITVVQRNDVIDSVVFVPMLFAVDKFTSFCGFEKSLYFSALKRHQRVTLRLFALSLFCSKFINSWVEYFLYCLFAYRIDTYVLSLTATQLFISLDS